MRLKAKVLCRFIHSFIHTNGGGICLKQHLSLSHWLIKLGVKPLQAQHTPERQLLWQPFSSGQLISVLPQAEQKRGEFKDNLNSVEITFQTSQTAYLTLLPFDKRYGDFTDSGSQFKLPLVRKSCWNVLRACPQWRTKHFIPLPPTMWCLQWLPAEPDREPLHPKSLHKKQSLITHTQHLPPTNVTWQMGHCS